MCQVGRKKFVYSSDIVVGFEIFKIAQETKKLAPRAPEWASPRGYPVGPQGCPEVPRGVNHGSIR